MLEIHFGPKSKTLYTTKILLRLLEDPKIAMQKKNETKGVENKTKGVEKLVGYKYNCFNIQIKRLESALKPKPVFSVNKIYK